MRGCIRVLLFLRHFALVALLRWPLSCGFAVALLFRLSSWFAAVGLPVWAVLPACVVAPGAGGCRVMRLGCHSRLVVAWWAGLPSQ